MILIILATISINIIFGNNGLITSAKKGKLEQEIAEARERLSLVLADAHTEKIKTTEMTQEEFLANELERFVKKQEANANIFNEGGKDYISLNGYIFVLNRSVPELGEYDGTEANRPPRIYSINVDNKTFTEITVNIQARMPEGATLRYSIKKLAEEDTAYTQVEEKTDLTNTFEGLTSPETYRIRVEILVNGEVQHTLTKDVRLGEYEKGTIEFGIVTWQGVETASTTITTSTTYQLQYQIVSEENEPTDGGWKNISNGGTIQNIPNKSSVYGRLVEGTNTSDYAVLVVKDEIKPKINSFEAIEITSNSIKVQANATDNESGLPTTNTYKFYLDDETEAKGTSTDGTYTYTNLNGLTGYKLRVEVYDNSGNKEESTINVTTKEVTIEDVLDISDNQKIYVKIPNIKKPEETILCNVLYNDSTNGLQIISVDSVETVTLGYEDPTVEGTDYVTKAMNSYNNAITTLNNKAKEYIDEENENYALIKDIVEEARSVGSNPTTSSAEAGYFTKYSYVSSKYQLRDIDENYSSDYNKMTALGIAGISNNSNYWLASRFVASNYSHSYFYIRKVNSRGESSLNRSDSLCYVYSTNGPGAYSNFFGLRPCFTLKSGIKITGGDGKTAETAYTLGV